MDEDAVGLLQLHQHWGAEGGDCQAVDHQDEWLGLPEEPGGLRAAQAAGGDRRWRGQHSLLIEHEHDPVLRKNKKIILKLFFIGWDCFILQTGHFFPRILYSVLWPDSSHSIQCSKNNFEFDHIKETFYRF